MDYVTDKGTEVNFHACGGAIIAIENTRKTSSYTTGGGGYVGSHGGYVSAPRTHTVHTDTNKYFYIDDDGTEDYFTVSGCDAAVRPGHQAYLIGVQMRRKRLFGTKEKVYWNALYNQTIDRVFYISRRNSLIGNLSSFELKLVDIFKFFLFLAVIMVFVSLVGDNSKVIGMFLTDANSYVKAIQIYFMRSSYLIGGLALVVSAMIYIATILKCREKSGFFMLRRFAYILLCPMIAILTNTYLLYEKSPEQFKTTMHEVQYKDIYGNPMNFWQLESLMQQIKHDAHYVFIGFAVFLFGFHFALRIILGRFFKKKDEPPSILDHFDAFIEGLRLSDDKIVLGGLSIEDAGVQSEGEVLMEDRHARDDQI